MDIHATLDTHFSLFNCLQSVKSIVGPSFGLVNAYTYIILALQAAAFVYALFGVTPLALHFHLDLVQSSRHKTWNMIVTSPWHLPRTH